MKRLICVLLCAAVMISLCSCGEKAKAPSGATEDEANYPSPDKENFVESKTETGLLYNMTLDKYTAEFNKMYLCLGGRESEFPYKKWKLLKKETQNNGMTYGYYALDSGNITLTATVDNESLYIVNLGCGTTADKFNRSKNFQQKVMTVCGTVAAVAGGYKADDVKFFGNLFVDTLESADHCFWYKDSIYLYSGEKDISGKTSMLFRTIPATSDIEAEWNLVDYKEYWLGN